MNMLRTFFAYFVSVIALSVAVFVGYQNRIELGRSVEGLATSLGIISPCTSALEYSIGTFDNHFGLSQEQLLLAAARAESIWESTIGRDLFSYAEDGDLKLDMVYDYRQEATNRLEELGDVIEGDKSSYEAQKARYQSYISQFNSEKDSFERDLATYNSRKSAYESEVAYWNGRGGASNQQFNQLEAERQALNSLARKLSSTQNALNNLTDAINTTASSLNRIARELNLTVRTYNTVGRSAGEEFNAGEYIRDSTGERISIYQFENTEKLVRLLAHEFGHALGLDHIEDSKAIMYRLNSGDNGIATEGDIIELKRVCKIQQ